MGRGGGMRKHRESAWTAPGLVRAAPSPVSPPAWHWTWEPRAGALREDKRLNDFSRMAKGLSEPDGGKQMSRGRARTGIWEGKQRKSLPKGGGENSGASVQRPKSFLFSTRVPHAVRPGGASDEHGQACAPVL